MPGRQQIDAVGIAGQRHAGVADRMWLGALFGQRAGAPRRAGRAPN